MYGMTKERKVQSRDGMRECEAMSNDEMRLK